MLVGSASTTNGFTGDVGASIETDVPATRGQLLQTEDELELGQAARSLGITAMEYPTPSGYLKFGMTVTDVASLDH
jgi:hypothetical protein